MSNLGLMKQLSENKVTKLYRCPLCHFSIRKLISCSI